MAIYWRNLLRFLLVTVAVAFFGTALVGLPYVSAYNFLHPARGAPARTPTALGMAYEDVRFQGDGIELAGWFIPGTTGMTIIVMGGVHDAERSGPLDLMRELNQQGYSLLLFDLRAHGSSGGEIMTWGYREPQDVLAAVAYLKTRADVDPEAIGLLGYSLGGAIALQATARSDDVKGVVADSAFATLQDALDTNRRMLGFLGAVFPLIQTYAQWQAGFRVDQVRPIDSVRAISPRPVLFIHGTADDVLPFENSVRMFKAAGEPKDLWLVPGAEHVKSYERHPVEYAQRVGDLFRRAAATASR